MHRAPSIEGCLLDGWETTNANRRFPGPVLFSPILHFRQCAGGRRKFRRGISARLARSNESVIRPAVGMLRQTL
jgi:hypothetical protein